MRLLDKAKFARVPCRQCQARIDQDWHQCPFCRVDSPVTLWTRCRVPLVGFIAAAIAAGTLAFQVVL